MCASAYDRARSSAARRGYDRDWQAFRADYLRRYPTCCVAGCGQPATDVDHIVALREGGGRFDPVNCRPMCKRHHAQRTISDQGANRGKGVEFHDGGARPCGGLARDAAEIGVFLGLGILMKGRKPKLAVIEGGAAPGRCPGPPTWLTLHAKREWKRVAPSLHRRGLLAPDTLSVLESYCVASGQVREFEETMARDGRLVDGEDGPKPHPAFRMQQAAMREARLLASELGVTPHRRGKTEDESKGDLWHGMLE